MAAERQVKRFKKWPWKLDVIKGVIIITSVDANIKAKTRRVRTELCGTPHVRGAEDDIWPLTLTQQVQSSTTTADLFMNFG